MWWALTEPRGCSLMESAPLRLLATGVRLRGDEFLGNHTVHPFSIWRKVNVMMALEVFQLTGHLCYSELQSSRA